ncbi:fibronectin type III domain-containing protein [Schlesneria sp. DSM 10557]|uniref:fibronectin type III domain-containing protein n=1 Tax=Schlesneria sp. DSM 10557 TaxID=3044399 RepID=UPI0035A1CA2B
MRCIVCSLAISGWLLSSMGCGTSAIAIDSVGEPDAPTPIKVADAEAYKPTPLPDRVILSWTGDPSRTQAVTWRTDTTVKQGLAEIAVAGDNGVFSRSARQLTAKTTPLQSNLSNAHYHTVEFNALTPKTKYAYRVGDGLNWTEWYHFETASDQAEPFTFIYFGDAQTEVKSLWSRVIREAFTDAPKARFLLHAGDLINRANSDAEWGEWHWAGGWMNAMIPNVTTPGNHEYERVGPEKIPHLSNHWKPQFALPENGPPNLIETAYFVDFQGTRIISLNSNEKIAEQNQWLESVLASRDSSIRWTIVTMHHPIYSSAKNRDNLEIRNNWQPLFDKYKIDLVLQGHDHTYARSGLVNSTTGVTAQGDQGTVYVVSVSGPKLYDIGKPIRPEFQRVAEDTQLFQIITVDGNELRYQARTATGQPYDGFTLVKKSGEVNQLIEQVPSTPARLRAPK